MDAGIADTINRRFADLFAEHLDSIDADLGFHEHPWHLSPIAASLMGENDATDADRAWLVGMLIHNSPDLDIDGHPADADWENLFTNIRAAIEARRTREPENPTREAGRDPASAVV